MRSVVSAVVLGFAGALAVIAAEPGHTAYKPHPLLPKPKVHRVVAELDRTVDRIAARS